MNGFPYKENLKTFFTLGGGVVNDIIIVYLHFSNTCLKCVLSHCEAILDTLIPRLKMGGKKYNTINNIEDEDVTGCYLSQLFAIRCY